MNRIYTAGYGGHRAVDLKRVAADLGAIVADIRINPTSKRAEWTRRELEFLLGDRYVHVPELGNVNAGTDGPIQIADEPGGVLKILRLARRAPVILLCGCPTLAKCHRLTVTVLLAPNVRAAGAPPIEEIAWPAYPVREMAPGRMKALTLWQPHASLFFLPLRHRKIFETRGWATNYRGPVAIHAGLAKGSLETCEYHPFLEELVRAGLVDFDGGEITRYHLPMGAVVGVADLVDCRPTGDWCREMREPARDFGDFSPGRFAWQMENPRPLSAPLLLPGGRNLFEVWAGPIRELLLDEGAPPTRASSPWPEPKTPKAATSKTAVRKPKAPAEAYAAHGPSQVPSQAEAPAPNDVQPTLF